MRFAGLLGVGLLFAGLAWPSAAVVVTDEHGAVRWRAPVGDGTSVVLQYTHSLYLAPTWEQFVVRGGRLHLREISSTREAVLEYNRLAPPYRWDGPVVAATVPGIVLDTLALRVGERGRPVLHVGGTVLPLYQAGVGTGLRVAVRQAPRVLTWLRR